MRIILLGAPGSGKGTICKALCDKYEFVHISTGDLFRQNIREGTPLGKEVRSFLEAGQLVPDDLTLRLVKDALSERYVLDHFLLDGFPRTARQAALFHDLLEERKSRLDAVLYMNVPDEVIEMRLAGRRICRGCGKTFHMVNFPPPADGHCDQCGGEVIQRKDDMPEVVEARLKTYHQLTAPLVEYYKGEGVLLECDNTGPVAGVLEALEAKLPLAKLLKK